MSNPIFDSMFGRRPSGPAQLGQIFNQAKRSIPGNPEAMAKQLLQSGQMSQQQLNEYGQIASNLMRQFPGMFR